MKTKDFPVRVKLMDDETTEDGGEVAGVFEALVSVFGNKDSYGEIVMPGAFSKTLAAWEERGDPIPVYWSHRMDDPDFNIGHVLEAKETDDGLYVKAQLDLTNPKAKTTHNLLRTRRVTQFSFAFSIAPGGSKESESGDATELTELNLYEVGPTPIGANPDTELISAKAGRVLSAKNIDKINAARDAMKAAESALTELLQLNSDDGKSVEPQRKAKIDEPMPAKIDEPAGKAMDELEARILFAYLEGVVA